MKVEDNLLSMFKVLFTERSKWDFVTDKQKEDYFFILNRYLSKRYLKQAKLLNSKFIDKVSGMNIWFHFLKNEPYPKWFWEKSKKEKVKNLLTNSEYKELRYKLKISKEDMDYLISEHPDFIKEENNRLKKLQKQK